jgi:hypothetical protein
MNVPHVRDRARVSAGIKGHDLGKFIWNPPAAAGYRRAPADQQGLAVCRHCEATVSMRGPELTGTALTHACPFHYSPEMLADIDRRNPVVRSTDSDPLHPAGPTPAPPRPNV